MILDALAKRAGVTWLWYQRDALVAAQATSGPAQRLCLYYKTGAGKSLTALAALALWGHSEAVVVAPPSTHMQWVLWGQKLGITTRCMSHALFRMKKTKLSRSVPVIADEFHLFGGNTGMGWKKLDKLAEHLQAPLILASATPNYNDAERVYCIQHVMDPLSCRGGFIQFLSDHCLTQANPHSMTPNVIGFRNYPDAAAYLAALPGVAYLPDDLVYTIEDIYQHSVSLPELDKFGINTRADRIIASQMEERHARVNLALIDGSGFLRSSVYALLAKKIGQHIPILVFAAHATVADALGLTLRKIGLSHAVVTGGSTAKQKNEAMASFVAGRLDVLVGTATLATGTDGLDKVCDTLFILDDTDDDSLRRQLIGRIMPRGTATNASMKRIFRLVFL